MARGNKAKLLINNFLKKLGYRVEKEKNEKINFLCSFSHQKIGKTKIFLEAGLTENLKKYQIITHDRRYSRHVLITDENVDAVAGDLVERQLKRGGFLITKFVVPAGESSKSMKIYESLAEQIVALGIDEQSVVIAVGGGVVANLSGFLASTLYRGIDLVHIPTTIMNMADVSISLKQGINSKRGKNLVGNYHQPLAVFIDPQISIPDHLVRDGLSEVIKHAICQDKDFFDYLLDYGGPLNDLDFRTHIIQKTIALKLKVMEEDMYEKKRGMILQYGHEVGHAVEFLSGMTLTHGQGIAIGMTASARLARFKGIADKSIVALHEKIFKKYGLPTAIPSGFSIDSIVESLRYNKKTKEGDIYMVLPKSIGAVWTANGEYGIPCSPETIKKALIQSNEI